MTRLLWPSSWKALLVNSAVAFYGAFGHAQTLDKVCYPNDPQNCVQGLIVGQTAPFTGMLMTNRRAAKLGVMAEGCQDRIVLSVGEANDLAQIQIQGLQAMRKNDQDAEKLQKDLLLKQLEKAEELYSPRWYERPAFVATVTAILSVAVLSVAIKVIQVTAK